MNDQTFQSMLSRLEPAANDPAQALAISYAAGRRDEAAAAQGTLVRWRVAAGLLLAATVGLSAMQMAGRGPDRAPPQVAGSGQADPAEMHIDAPPPEEPLRPLPGSYASLRSAVMSSDGIELGALPGPRPGGPGGAVERPISSRDAL